MCVCVCVCVSSLPPIKKAFRSYYSLLLNIYMIPNEGPIRCSFSVPAHLCTNHVRAGSLRPGARGSTLPFFFFIFIRSVHEGIHLWDERSLLKMLLHLHFTQAAYCYERLPPLGGAVAKDKATLFLCAPCAS